MLGMGAMGSAVARLLLRSGAEVFTSVEGRSTETRRRAAAAGIRTVDLMTVVDADIILSIVPPSQAITVAQQVAKATSIASASRVFVDCNAVSPKTMTMVASAFAGSAVRVLDGCIIGGPPPEAGGSPHVYISGGGNDVVQ